MKSLLGSLFVASSVVTTGAVSPPPSSDASERAMKMLQQMNTTEKLAMLHGHKGLYIGNIDGNERLGIPALHMHDGPQGFRVTGTTAPTGSTTAWPSGLSVAASWDVNLMYKWHAAMATEFKGKGANIFLGPGIGIARIPNAGRNFEYLCGEDPYLGSILVIPAVNGIQDQGIMANAKHYVNNEIEEQRKLVSAEVDERTRFELYYPPFDAAVKAGAHTVMCAYNRINGVYACENKETLTHLYETMGFKGWVFSDWTATHSTADSLNAGNFQEMPFGIYLREEAVTAALESGEVSMETIDNGILRMLTAMYDIGLFDHEPTGDRNAIVTSEEHSQLSRELAAKSAVLLRNEPPVGETPGTPLLPLDLKGMNLKRIAVIGDNSTVSGTGSGHVTPAYIVTPEEGIRNAVAAAGLSSTISVEYLDGKDVSSATALASQCDIVIVNVATTCGEGNDRATLALGDGQDELIDALIAANPRTIVSVVSPGPVLMPWAKQVPAVIESWLPGQEAGNALADVLFGLVNPSARLHVTMPNKDNEVGFSEAQYPGIGKPPSAYYTEGLLIGYRLYEAHNLTPNFCFGHGLSYSSFAYDQLKVTLASPSVAVTESTVVVTVSVELTNTGYLSGSEIPQLYISFPAEAKEPPKVLKGFLKVELGASEAKTVEFQLSQRDLSIWNTDTHSWQMLSGEYTALVGASSCDLRGSVTFSV